MGWGGEGGHAGEVFAFRRKDASLILSKAVEEDPIATGGKKTQFGRTRSGGRQRNVILMLFSVPCVCM